MSLSHAILGFLQTMPLTGYDLKTQAFDESVDYFWPVVQPQIYRELDKMLTQGWVQDDLVIQEGRPNRRVYTITGAGRAELARWLRAFHPLPAYRDAFLIQLFFAAPLSNAEIIALLDDQRRAHQALLADLERIAQEMANGYDDQPSPVPWTPRDQRLIGLTLDLGLRLQHTYIDWLTDAIRTVNTLADGSASD